MRDLFKEYMKIRVKHPVMQDMAAYKFLRYFDKELITEEIHILERAHSASRAGMWHDTESTLFEKKRLRERYGIDPRMEGAEVRVVRELTKNKTRRRGKNGNLYKRRTCGR